MSGVECGHTFRGGDKADKNQIKTAFCFQKGSMEAEGRFLGGGGGAKPPTDIATYLLFA